MFIDSNIFLEVELAQTHGRASRTFLKMITTKVDKMGRTVIPSLIRRMLNIKEGDYVE